MRTSSSSSIAIARQPAQSSTVSSGKRLLRYAHPDAAAALTAGMRAEIGGRALEGGDPGGTSVTCTLDRLAVRDSTSVTTSTFAVLYVDLACDAVRATGGALVWRGELRGRGCARTLTGFARGASGLQTLLDRTMSDVARELASDLLVRALGLRSTATSARVFDDEAESADIAGVDDGALGKAALAEDLTSLATAASVDGGAAGMLAALADPKTGRRAQAWNALAMASGPGDPWPLDKAVARDGDERVRFYQYKALAREASPAALAELQAAVRDDGGSLASEMARDALASGGLGLPRRANGAGTNGSVNGSAVTNGTTTSP